MAKNAGDAHGKLIVGLDDKALIDGINKAAQAVEKATERMEKATTAVTQAMAQIGAVAQQNAQKAVQANNALAESEKRLTATVKAESRERMSAARQAENASYTKRVQGQETARRRTIRQRGTTAIDVAQASSAARVEETEMRESAKRRTIITQRNNNELVAINRDWVNKNAELYKRETANFRDQLSARREMYRREIKQLGTMSQQWQAAMDASIRRTNNINFIGATAAQTGQRPSDVLFGRINAAAAASNYNYQQSQVSAGGGGRRGGFGLLGRVLGMGGGGAAGAMLSSLAGGFGVGVGGYALARGIDSTRENVERATAYDRQRVAAENLSGSQAKLNELLEEYIEASGGAIDKSTALESVSRLLATGYAESAEEVSKFVRATRGSSLAMGRPQDYIVQETQLAISNTSFRRLDQIGLGIEEVQDRIRDLRQENQGMTRDVAFQIAVLDLLEEKYGVLADSAEGQASGIERLSAAWSDLGLQMGQVAQGPVNALTTGMGLFFNLLSQWLDSEMKKLDYFILRLREIGVGASLTTTERSWVEESGSRMGQRMAQRGQDRIIKPRFNEEQEAAILEWNQAGAEIERKFNRQIAEETRQYSEQRASTIRQYEKQIAREAEDFAKQRARAEEDYQKSVEDVLEDSARQQQDALAGYNKSIVRARRDHERGLADMAEDYNIQRSQREEDYNESRAEAEEQQTEKLEEIRKEGRERLAEIDRNFNKQREQAERQHRETVENLASRFDARAIYEEKRRFEREQSERLAERDNQRKEEVGQISKATEEAVKEYEERRAKEQAAFDKQERRAEEAYNRQVDQQNRQFNQQLADQAEDFEEQRKATADQEEIRLQDMADDFQERKDREDADRLDNLTRMGEDHQDQLDELDRQHDLRIAQIQEQAQEERDQLDAEFNLRLGELQLQTEAWYTEQEQLVDDAITAFDKWWENTQKKLTEDNLMAQIPSSLSASQVQAMSTEELMSLYRGLAETEATSAPGSPARRQAGEGKRWLERYLESKGISPGDSEGIISASGISTDATTSPVIASSAGISGSASYGGATYIVSPGAVNIQAAPGQSEEALGMIVEQRLIAALERASGAYVQ